MIDYGMPDNRNGLCKLQVDNLNTDANMHIINTKELMFMASGFLRSFNETYVVTVRRTDRGSKVVETKKFTNYDQAMNFCDAMEEKYGHKYSVEFDTVYK